MAGSFSTAKAVSAFIGNRVSAVAASRGYEAASRASLRTGAPNVMLKKGSESESAKHFMGPDPVTGYYRPDNHANEIDAADLRQMLVINKTTPN